MSSSLRRKLVSVTSALALMAAVAGGTVAEAAELTWKPDTFEGTFSNADVRDVLRRVIQANGMQVIFRPGVEGTVDGSFDMPLQGAFTKLVEENGLSYEYDAVTNMVTVYSGKSKVAQEFVPLNFVSPAKVRASLGQFGIMANVTIDEKSRVAFIKGSADQVQQAKSMIMQLEESARGIAETAASREKDIEEAKLMQLRREQLERLMNLDVKVIRLRFASVTTETRVFSGKKYTVPGVGQTLRNLLGLGSRYSGLGGAVSDVASGVAATGQTIGERRAIRGQLDSELALNRPYISTDRRTNSVIVRGTPDAIAQVEEIIKQLDKPVPMIEIEVMIVKATDNVSDTFGVDWAWESNVNHSNESTSNGEFPDKRFGGVNTGIVSGDPTGVTAGLVDAAATGAAGQYAAATTGILGGYVWQGTRWALQARLNALESDSKTQTLASPTLVTLDNESARVESTGSEYINVSAGDGSSNTLVEIDAGVSIDITPSVIMPEESSDQPLVRMAVQARNTAVGAASTSGGTASTSGQEVQTEVIIPENRTFIMAGLMDDTRTENQEGIPMLQNLPVLGPLFGTNSQTDNFSETLFFITPDIVYPDEILPRDIAERRYLKSRKVLSRDMRLGLQSSANVIANAVTVMEEDE